MHILIVGTGALATLFAARLAQAGSQVSMLGTWAAGLEALRTQGARFVDPQGVERHFPVNVLGDAHDRPEIKYALILVKSWQTSRAAAQLASCLAEDGLAVTLQNGLGNREILSGRLGPQRVALGVTTTGATLLAPGLARDGGAGTLSLESHPAIHPLAQALHSANFQVEVVPDAASLVWGKLVINAAINPLTALLRVPNGVLLERPAARELMKRLAGEAAAVAQAEGVRLPFTDPLAAAEAVAHRTAANHSSMLQDVLRGAPTEIDAICGAVARTAAQHGIQTPANWSCWKLIKAMVGFGA